MKFELEIIRAVAYGFGAPDPFKQHEPKDNRVQSQFFWLEHTKAFSPLQVGRGERGVGPEELKKEV